MRALLLPLLAACAPDPPSLPPTAPTLQASPGCEGFEVEARLDLAGPIVAVAEGGGLTWAATDTRVDGYLDLMGPPVARVPIDGEPRALLWAGDALWVAAGSGGIARAREPGRGAEAVVHRWATGGEVVALTLVDGTIWAADRAGRVLALPLGARPEDAPRSVDLDGMPSDISFWRDEVVVALGGAGVAAIEPRTGVVRILDARPTLSLAPMGRALALRSEDALSRVGDGPEQQVALPSAPGPVLAVGDQMLSTARDGGLWAWDGAEAAARRWSLRVDERDLPAIGLTAGAYGVLVAAHADGMARLALEPSGARLVGWTAPTGTISALHSLSDRVIVSLEWQDGALGGLVTLTEEGGQIAARREERPTSAFSVAEVADGIAMGALGLALTRPGKSDLTLLPRDHVIFDLVAPSPDRLAALTWGEGLIWWERGAEGWAQGPSRALPSGGQVLGALGQGVLVGPGTGATALIFDGPEAAQGRRARLAGTPGDQRAWPPYTRATELRRTGAAEDDSRLWLALPDLGVQAFEADGRPGALLRVPGGALDVALWGEDLLIAAGTEGVALLDPGRRESPVIARCDLPGITLHVGRLGQRALAATWSTLFVLQRSP